MLPRATNTRGDRESVKGRLGGRTQEISRLVGRSLRACVDPKALGENTIIIDCDVLQADGGTRTAAITGGYVALADAVGWLQGRGRCQGNPLVASVAAVSVGIVDGEPRLDLCYEEDVAAQTDMNVVCTGDGELRRDPGHRRARAVRPRRCSTSCSTSAWPGCAELTRLQRGPRSGCMSDAGWSWPPATRSKLAELRRILADAGRAGRASSTSAEFPDVPDVAETGAHVRRERAAQGARGGRVHRPARGRRRLRPVRRRAERDARRAVRPLVRPARRRRGEPAAACWPSSPTCPTSRRGAHFACAAALVLPSGAEQVTEGAAAAADPAPRAARNGFGYDPIFVPDGAELHHRRDERRRRRTRSATGAARCAPSVIAELLAG